eukprot:g10825.t1
MKLPGRPTGELKFELVQGKTACTTAYARYPIKFVSATRASDDGCAWVYTLGYGGGAVCGDQVIITCHVEKESTAALATQGSTKVFKRGSKSEGATAEELGTDEIHRASQTLLSRVSTAALLAIVPDPVTCFKNSSFRQHQRFLLERGASLVLVDWVTSGRMSRGEGWAFNRLESRNEVMVEAAAASVSTSEGRAKPGAWQPLVLDSLVLEDVPGLSVEERMLGMKVVGVLVLLGPRVEELVATVLEVETRRRSRFPPGLEPRGGAAKGAAGGVGTADGDKAASPPRKKGRTLSSVSPLQGGVDGWCKGLVYRFAAERTDDARAMLHDLLLPLQPALGGKAPYSREARPAMAQQHGLTHPSTWPEVTESMNGFPFPQLTSARDVRVLRPGASEDPQLVVLPDGQTFYLQRRLVNSLFGAVFHGLSGKCTDPNDPNTFVMPRDPEHHFHVAVKRSSLAEMRRTPQENVFREISVMRYLASGVGHAGGHQFVMPLVAACMSRTHVYVVTPYCGGGDLLKMVTPEVGTGVAAARKWFRQILLGLAYVHSKGLCHHDFSPENVVITRMGDAAVVMDFGMVTRMRAGPHGGVLLNQDANRYGKLRYMAPEIYQVQPYDGRKIDIWSTGVTLLVCLYGEYPWAAPTRIPSPGVFGTSEIWSYTILAQHGAGVMLDRLNLPERISAAAVNLLCEMLVIDHHARPHSAASLAQHPFFTA